MLENLYYDRSNHKMLRKEDSCSFEDWPQKHLVSLFALHSKDFLIFLHPKELDSCDEYSGKDPYGVETGLSGDFQKRRIDCTIDLIKTIIPQSPSNLKVLDIGCGQGHKTKKIHELIPNAEISGLDYSLSAINKAVDDYSDINFCVANADDPPYQSEYFDIVVCNNVWEHVPYPVFLLSKISTITKPGGYLILSTPSRYRFGNIVSAIMGKRTATMSPMHVTEYSIGQIIQQLSYGKYIVEKIHSKRIKDTRKSIKVFLGYSIIYPILDAYLRMINSQHRLESTIFFLAKKK